ncbi:M17 family metallopeptidase [Janibacter sp. GXQ6167]|uniref:leucyl aminopeptidase family protein n=1 Tax=Janibacter sp. GXQ6167 TaxID=3240791 RepID=UPI0035256667
MSASPFDWPEGGEVRALVAGDRRVVLVGAHPDDRALRRGAAAAARALLHAEQAIIALAGPVSAQVEGLVLGGYRSQHFGRGEFAPGATPVAVVTIVDPAADEEVVERAQVAARASLLARGLANAPSNLKNPAWMVERAQAVASRRGLEITVWDEEALAVAGFGGLLAVGGGSVSPPRLVRLDYRPEGASDAPFVVLVGKGITFDTGGISVKPADGMVSMRTDMSGSAIVLAVIDAVAALGLTIPVTVLMPLAENSFAEGSYRPSDIVTPYGGKRTVEITNTDAEGRMVLADALAYADLELEPDLLIDVATLTGAARIALARSMAALFSDDDELVGALREAGVAAGEPFWRLPLHDDYRSMIDSAVADLDQAPGKAGAITAALFLREFVGERRWAHLDVAGPGRSDDDTGLLSKGATGYGARALLRLLEGLT